MRASTGGPRIDAAALDQIILSLKYLSHKLEASMFQA